MKCLRQLVFHKKNNLTKILPLNLLKKNRLNSNHKFLIPIVQKLWKLEQLLTSLELRNESSKNNTLLHLLFSKHDSQGLNQEEMKVNIQLLVLERIIT